MKGWRGLILPAVAAATAIGLTFALLPSPTGEGVLLRNWGSSELRRGIERAFALRDSARVYQAAWRLADTRERTAIEPPAGPGLTLRSDRTVPPAEVARYRQLLLAEIATLTDTPQHSVVVRLLIDSTAAAGHVRAVVIPATPDAPCTVHIRLALLAQPPRELRGDQLLGVCGLYAKFGPAGKGMTRWLTRTSMSTAAMHTASPLGPAFTPATLRRGAPLLTEPFALACVVGRYFACRAQLEGTAMFDLPSRLYVPRRLRSARQLTSSLRIAVFSPTDFDRARRNKLAAVRATLGDDRFALLWSDDREPSEAFAAREGRPLEALMSAAQRGEGAAYRPGGGVSGWALGVVVAFVAMAFGATLGLSRRVYVA